VSVRDERASLELAFKSLLVGHISQTSIHLPVKTGSFFGSFEMNSKLQLIGSKIMLIKLLNLFTALVIKLTYRLFSGTYRSGNYNLYDI
jgi:hypothetical protein